MPVRTPHATSRGNICHLGAEIEPIPEVVMFSPQRNYGVFAGVRVRAPTAHDYRPLGKRGRDFLPSRSI